ncbi:MAG: response regulator transcription factor [Gammaproteobacteria bacterium]|nr:response regulator transcription factor [Gammaproteobacteria bacterium]MDH3464796.1 response regulator transcription factor [Gammaproteobacteria bacterium]
METVNAKARRALVIEDDPDIGRLVCLHLGDLHIESDLADTGPAGVALFERGDYDLVILDLMLPGIDGLQLCRQIRQHSELVPILMLTAKSAELDRVLGLEIGADDYMTKPFSVAELLARVKALLRRVDAVAHHATDADDTGRLQLGDLLIDLERRQVSVADKEIELTRKEFDLLRHFARWPGRVYTRSQLLSEVWGYGHEGYQHTVNSHINRLRAKIEHDPARPELILTVWGVGYKLAETLE